MDIPFFKRIFGSGGFSFWGEANPSILGIDIGSASLKVAQLRKSKERAVLETYGELASGPYGSGMVGQAAHLVEEKVVEMLTDILRESGATAKEAVVSVPLRNSFITVIEMPLMSDADLANAINFEARRYIPVPIGEVIIDWWAVPEGFGGEKPAGEEAEGSGEAAKMRQKMEVLLVAIHRDVIEKYQTIIKKAGLKLRAIEIEVFSTIRSLLGRELSAILIIDIGASSTKMAIVDYGIIRISHSIDSGGQDLTLALSKSLSVDFTRAEELKREIGISPLPEHKETVSAIEPILDYIFSEASRVTSDYLRKRQKIMSRVILTGGGSLLKGIVGFAVNKFGTEVNLANPFIKLDYPAFLQPALKEVGPSFSTAIGLALREF